MTNITLSIQDSVYKRMRKHSEVKWSEFVRRAINERLDDLDSLDKRSDKESILVMLASEDVLKRDWDNKQDDRWDNV